MACCLATTTWDSIDHVEIFLAHYRKLGVEQMLVMDFDSTDGTRDVLAAREWQGFVRHVAFPGLENLDSSNVMLDLLKPDADPGDWCLFCDPDELLVTPAMTITDLTGAGDSAQAEAVSIPRFNVTGSRAEVEARDDRASALDALVLRIDRRAKRNVGVDMLKGTLDPPWIYTAIPGKVMVKTLASSAIGDGDHVARTSKPPVSAPAGAYLLHYPFRSYALFRDKIERARSALAANPHLPPGYGWQIRRWIRLADERRLHDEYLQQFVADADLQSLLSDGTLSRDLSVPRFHGKAAH